MIFNKTNCIGAQRLQFLAERLPVHQNRSIQSNGFDQTDQIYHKCDQLSII